MPDIAVGRKEIMAVLHVGSWRTVQRYRKKDPEFDALFGLSPINQKPFVVIREYVEYLIKWKKSHFNASKEKCHLLSSL